MRVGSLVFATEQGLGILAKSFFDAGVVTDVMAVRHGRRPEREDWYPSYSRIHSLKEDAGSIRKFCNEVDVMLFFETPFDWTLLDYCRGIGVKTVLMPMYECMPKVLPAQPDLFLCPSLLDLSYYPSTDPSTQSGKRMGYDPDGVSSRYLPIPVEQRWYQRDRAEIFVHNAGHGGLKGRNGTQQFLEAIQYVKSDAKFVLRVQDREFAVEKQLLDRIKDRLMIEGTLPYDRLFLNGDVFVFPERFNGLSLPLQEARAAGMLVMATDRFPMNIWLPGEAPCPGCDGEGSLMYQLAKKDCVRTGGVKYDLSDGTGWYYKNGIGQEIGFKTIGGSCVICQGKKVVSPLIKVSTTCTSNVSPMCNDFEESIVDPRDIAAKVDEWYGRDITAYSQEGRKWAETMSWKVMKPRYLEVLEQLCKSN